MSTSTRLSGLVAVAAVAALAAAGCGNTAEATEAGHATAIETQNVSVERNFDEESETYYFLTHVDHEDGNGNVLDLEHAHANDIEGETVDAFSDRMNDPMVAVNASTMYSSDDGEVQATGIQIIDGEVIQDRSTSMYTLGVQEGNNLVAYEPGITADEVLNDGAHHALSAFIPMIENSEPVPDDILSLPGHSDDQAPRQVIAQLDNNDILIMSTGGRGIDGEGMTSYDLVRVLMDEGVEFAFMLDGGGSVTTMVEGEQITEKMDNGENRSRPNFLYFD